MTPLRVIRCKWFVPLTAPLVSTLSLPSVPEVAALGLLWCVDWSQWDLPRPLHWPLADGRDQCALAFGLPSCTLMSRLRSGSVMAAR